MYVLSSKRNYPCLGSKVFLVTSNAVSPVPCSREQNGDIRPDFYLTTIREIVVTQKNKRW